MLNRSIGRLAVLGGILLMLGPAAAIADTMPLFTFGFTDLDGDYNFTGGGGSFTAVATARANGGPFDTAGDVTRIESPQGTANYDVGFAAFGLGDVRMDMTITSVNADAALGSGTFVITDANGDTITGSISGSWDRLGNFGAFSGLAGNVRLNDNSGDGRFDGPSGGSFLMDFGTTNPLNGAIIVLETGAWFNQSFTDKDVQIEASIVPAPGAALLGMIGLGLFGRMKRRVSA